MGAVRRAYTEANMEAEIQGQKLTEVITKLKGDLKTVAKRNARLLRKMTIDCHTGSPLTMVVYERVE